VGGGGLVAGGGGGGGGGTQAWGAKNGLTQIRIYTVYTISI